jgi:hypothetical protein
MSQVTVDVVGLEGFMNLAARLPVAINLFLSSAEKTLLLEIMNRTPVSDRRHAGRLKRSWQSSQLSQMEREFRSGLGYSGTIEIGGYPGVGPRTVAMQGGIFSQQAPGGILDPMMASTIPDELLQSLADQITRLLQGA